MKKLPILLFTSLCYVASHAGQTTVTLFTTEGEKKEIGTVVFDDTKYGLLIKPNLTSLPPGLHGFHLHQHPNCGDHGNDAGAHYDPTSTNRHQGPYGEGHLGDLPALYVNADGTANTPTLAPRLKTADLKGLSVMIHAGGDNYSDTPPLGGGGARIACGSVS
jgi:superoxide dismutase, Cu-Zn family